jgi:hypothetical protein
LSDVEVIVMAMPPDTLTDAVAFAVASAIAVATIVTTRSDGGLAAGAAYVAACPLSVFVGDIEPQGAAAHVTLQVTPRLLASLLTRAVT